MTKTCPEATVLSTSQPERMEELKGNLPLQYADGPDYCTVTDATGGAFALTVQPELMQAMEAALAAAPAVADPLSDLVSGFAKALLSKLRLASANGRSGWERDDWEKQCQQGLLRHLEKGDPRDVAAYCAFMWHHDWITAPPEQPALRGRESIANAIREYCRSVSPASVANSHGVERIYYAGLSVYGLTDAILSASPPEQPAAAPDIVKMYADAIDAKNARIGELEEALGKAVLSAPPEQPAADPPSCSHPKAKVWFYRDDDTYMRCEDCCRCWCESPTAPETQA